MQARKITTNQTQIISLLLATISMSYKRKCVSRCTGFSIFKDFLDWQKISKNIFFVVEYNKNPNTFVMQKTPTNLSHSEEQTNLHTSRPLGTPDKCCNIRKEKNPHDFTDSQNAPDLETKTIVVNHYSATYNQSDPPQQQRNVVLHEYVDRAALNRLFEHPDITRDDLRTLQRYHATLAPDGSREVTYRPSEHGVGRVYADRGLSLQFFPKRIRHTLANKLYHDIDVTNAHPVILLQLCSEMGWDAPQLRWYVENREKVLSEIIESCQVTRKQAKELLLRLMYGGHVKYWKRDERVPESLVVPAFVVKFEKELKTLQQLIWDKFPKIAKVAKKPKATKQFIRELGWVKPKDKSQNAAMGSCMSLVLQEREHRVMMACADFFQSHNWEVGVYVFDGIMIRKCPQKQLTTGIIQDCEKFVKNATGLTVKLEEKLMDCAYNLDFQLSRWDYEYAHRLLEGIELDDAKMWEVIATACKAIGMSIEQVWNWLKKQPQRPSEDQVHVLWGDPRTSSRNDSGWQVLEGRSRFLDKHATRPILDLQCPYGFDDLLQANSLDRIRFLAPKVLALITGEESGVWFKKVILHENERSTVRFVRMSDKLKSLADRYIDIVETVTVQKDGLAQQKETCQRVTLDVVIKKFVLSTDPSRMSFTKVDFYPYATRFGRTGRGVFNTFSGFPFLPCEDPTKLDYTLIQPFLDGMKEVLCNNDEALFTALCDFYTDILRHPERKSRVCPVLYSPEQQVGKGFFTLTLGKVLVGDELLVQVANDDLIVGTFNSSIEDKLIVIVDDPDAYGASFKLMGRLKNLVTEPIILIHRKNYEPYRKRSCVRCLYCSNTLDAISIEVFDKRFFVTQCSPSRVGQMEYFDNLAKIANEHDWVLWNYFYHRGVSSINWKNTLPVSAVKRQILRKKFPMPIQFALSCAEMWKGQDLEGSPNHKQPVIRWHYEALYQQYRTWAIHEGIDIKYLGKNWTTLEEPLKTLGVQPIESNKGRIMIQRRRLKGFQINRNDLLESVRAFMRKSGQDDDATYDPPDVDVEDDDDHEGDEEGYIDDGVLNLTYKPLKGKVI